jgi:O-antigen/teichoic acid export membrane protein
VLIAGRYGVAALGWITGVVIIRTLTASEFGQYSLIFSLLGIIGFVSELRISRIVLQKVLRARDADEAAQVMGSYTTLRLVIGAAAYLIAMLIVGIGYFVGWYPMSVVQATAVGGLVVIIASVAYGLTLLFEARLWLGSIAASNFWAQVAQLGATALFAALGIGSVLLFAWANVVNAVVTALWLLWAIRHVARIRLRFDRGQWIEWLKEGAPLAIGAALDTVYFRIDIVMLSVLDTFHAVGVYSVGYKFSDLLGAVPTAVVTPAMTLMVKAWPDDPAAFRRTFRHTLILLVVGSTGAAVGFGVFANPLMVHLYGEQYASGVYAARLLVVGQALHFFTVLAFITLVSAGRNRLYPIATLTGVVLNVVLNIVLIPRFSYNGSGWATIITETAVMCVLGIGVARIGGLRPLPWWPIGKCFFAAAVMYVAGEAMLGHVFWPVAGVLDGLIYLAILHVTRVDGPGGLRALLHGGAVDALDPTVAAPVVSVDGEPELGPAFEMALATADMDDTAAATPDAPPDASHPDDALPSREGGSSRRERRSARRHFRRR